MQGAAAELPEASVTRAAFLRGGQMAERLRSLEWAKTSLGPPPSWSPSFRFALQTCLSSQFPAMLWWGDDLTFFYNDAFATIFEDEPRARHLGRPGSEGWPELWARLHPMIESAMRAGRSGEPSPSVVETIFRADARFTVTCAPILSPDGDEVLGVYCPCVPAPGVEQLELAVEAANVGMFDWDGTSNAVHWSKELYALLGRTPADLTPSVENWNDLVHPDDREHGWEEYRRVTAAMLPNVDTLQRLMVRGVPRWFRSLSRVFYGPDGLPSRVIGAIVDVHALKTSEETHDRERRRALQLLAYVPALVNVLQGPDLVFELAHPKTVAFLRGRDLVGKPLLEAIPEHRGQPFHEHLQHVLRTGERVELHEVEARFSSGDDRESRTYWNSVYLPVRDEEGRITGVMTFDAEVTEAVLAKRETSRALQRLEIAARAVSGLVYDLDVATMRVWRMGSLLETLGLSPDGAAESWHELIHPDDRPGLMAQWNVVSRDRSIDRSRYEYRVRRPDGSYATVFDNQALERDDEGRVTRILGTTLDVSERASHANQLAALNRELEDALRFSEQFIGILGHDLRNPLNAIHMAAHLLKKQGDAAAQAKWLDRILASTARMTTMVAQLLDLTRSRLAGGIPVDRKPSVLGDVVLGVVDELRLVHPGRELVTSIEPAVRGTWDPERLGQVVSNLLDNALQYGAPDRAVTVRLRVVGEEACLDVHSFGPKIPADLVPVLFDPYRRGQGRGGRSKGLGLGLYISAQIVRAHEGTIDVTSDDELGTTFSLRLPITPSSYTSDPAATPVLVVEDDAEARDSLQELLGLEGFDVHAASNGLEAMDFIAAHREEECVALLDLFMPELDGWELLKAMRVDASSPKVKVVVMTSAPDMAPPGVAVLRKPLDPEVVVQAVRTASRRQSGARRPS